MVLGVFERSVSLGVIVIIHVNLSLPSQYRVGGTALAQYYSQLSVWVVLGVFECVSRCDSSCEPDPAWPVSCRWHGVGSVLQSAECVGGPGCVSRCDNSCEPVPAWPVSCRWHGVGSVLQPAW